MLPTYNIRRENDMYETRFNTTGGLRLVAAFLVVLFVAACGGGGGGEPQSVPDSVADDGEEAAPAPDTDGDDGGNAGTAPNQNETGPLEGPATALVGSVIKDTYVYDPVDPSEYGEDVVGREIQRTGVKIVFTDQATVGEANELLAEFEAEIIASLEGYPALVVRIPDPGTLQALETVVADLKSRGPVKSVLKSYAMNKRALPANVYDAIFESGNSDPASAVEWEYVSQHLAVRGAAAWHLQALAQQPVVVVGDGFGDGDPSATLYDIMPVPNETDFGVFPFGATEPHGYAMLSIIAARHSGVTVEEEDFFDPHWASGMVPVGVQFAAVDDTNIASNAFNAALILKLSDIADQTSGTIVANLSIGDKCTGLTETDPCQTQGELNDRVVDFIAMVRFEELEDRVLFVAAAGNIGSDAPQFGPTDAQSSSVYNAAGSLDGWFDPLNGFEVDPLTNVLIGENAAPSSSGSPYQPGCIFSESFIGGRIAGIGSAFAIQGSGESPSVSFDSTATGGTSSAAAQISGIAAYVSGVRPDFKPQDLIRILVKTGEAPSGQTDAACTPLDSNALVADAYAALLATDPPGLIDKFNALARLELLDIASDLVPPSELPPPGSSSPIPTVNPDGAFDIADLRRWIDVLTGPGAGEIDHGRFDLNGDGAVGGEGTERFDLDISMDPLSSSSIPFFIVNYDFIDTPVTYSEDVLTDIEIVCYYAMSPLYEIGGLDPFTAEGRAEELERVRNLCDPCAAAAAPFNAKGGASLKSVSSSTLAATTEAPICEDVVVTVDPGSASVQKGATVQFSANVTGAGDTSVTWSASGGSINQNGLYTAGSSPGTFTVTATSVANPPASGTATVIIPEGNPVKGQWLGQITVVADSGRVDTCATLVPEEPENCVEFAFKDEPWTPGFPETVRARLRNKFATEYFFTGTFDGNVFTGDRTRVVTNTGFTQVFEPGCVITLSVSGSTITGSMPEGQFFQGCDGKRQSQYFLSCAEEQGCEP